MSDSPFKFIDIHYHADPDLYKRKHHALDAGKIYKNLGGAVVLKSHLGSTSVQSTIAQNEGFPVFPSIVLNDIAGGLSYRSVIQALSEYQPVIPSKMIVDLPTITGRKHDSKLNRNIVYPLMSDNLFQPTTIFDSKNKMKKEIIDLLNLARDYPIVLSTGHASRNETYALIDACNKWDINLLLNQPANPLAGFNAIDLLEISKCPLIWIEQTALTYLLGYQTENDFSNVLKQIPNVIYSSDLGQTTQMDIPEWLINSKEWFTQFNITTQRQVDICLANPLQLLMIE